MYKYPRCLALLFGVLLLPAGRALFAQSIKVFSRYNYYQPGDKGCVMAALPDSLSPAGYRLILSRDGKELATKATTIGQVVAAAIDLEQLPMGTTILSYRCSKAGLVAAEGSVEIKRLPAKPNAVQIDHLTGGLIADGLPFFPFGFYCGPVGNLPEQEVVHGFTMIGPYQSNLPEGLADRKAYMDRCARIGMRVQYAVNSLIGSGHNGARGLALSDEEKLAILKNEIVAFRDHPALLSWYINDEPDGQGRPPALLEAAYKMIQELDPYHPISIVFMMPALADNFRHTMDIAMTDPYPIPGPADKVMEDVSKYMQAYRYEKAVWLVPQAFGGQEMWAREPTAQEIRLMTYMGLVSGAKGIQYYTHAPDNSNPQSVSGWSACSDIAVETAQMTGFLLSGEEAPAVRTGDPKVLARAFRYNGNLLVIAVNNENKPKPLTLDLLPFHDLRLGHEHDLRLGHEAELWFENRSVPFEDGHIGDIIDAYGTRVYYIPDRSATPAKSGRLLPGNLTLNPSFEKIVSPGLPIGSNMKPTTRQRVDPGATFFADPRLSMEGMFSLRLITPSDSGGDKIRLTPLVMNKGDSYVVSVYARAKQSDKMPVFRLSLDAMKETHDFTLTTEWHRYDFIFTAVTSSTNVILSLELLSRGTAWFDLLQVSPDPIIRYKINADHTATATISSDWAGPDHLRYAIGKEPDSTSARYRDSIVLDRPATLYAEVFWGAGKTAQSKVFIPVNRALGKPVTMAIPYDAKYPASGDGSLTDGLMGTTAFKDGRWLGFSGKDLHATVDLQDPIKVKEVTASFLCDPNSGIFLPPIVSVYTSVDGTQFELAGERRDTSGNIRGEPYLKKITIPVKGKKVRYVRVVARAFGKIPEGYLFTGSMSWLFIDEVLVL